MKYFAVRTLVILSLVLMSLFALGFVLVEGRGERLFVLTTFSNIKYDVQLLTDGKCYVDSLIPSGVDPHSYALSPGDAEKIHKADVIITTLHTPVEKQVDDIVRKGEINASYIVLSLIPGMKILRNPNTGEPNYHMIIYDPSNYILFQKTLYNTLVRLDPDNAKFYEANLRRILANVTLLLNEYKDRMQVRAVASMPPTQYAVSWLGINITRLLVSEPGLSATPNDIKKIDYLLSTGKASLAIVLVKYDPVKGSLGPSSVADEILLKLARKYGVKVLLVPNPVAPGDIIGKLYFVTTQLREYNTTGQTSARANPMFSSDYILRGSLYASILAIAGILFYYYAVKRRWRP
jgi:zinc/manganese transport system substrate-binding protein